MDAVGGAGGWRPRHPRPLQPDAAIWITEAGFSTWRHDEAGQVACFLETLAAPVDRVYWYGWQDLAADVPVQEGLHFDERHYHLGVTTETGRPKLLGRLLQSGGFDAAASAVTLLAPAVIGRVRPVAVVGGAGFIGCNLAESVLAEGGEVLVVDTLRRPGVEANLAWLRQRHGARVHPAPADVRSAEAMRDALADASAVFHFAAQVAVTSSLEDPADDFAVNVQGTFNVLEAVRAAGRDTPVIFASTNKVYGALEDVAVTAFADRYLPTDPGLRERGVDESRPLAFCTPYGCSKGAADQYVLDYAKSFGLRAAVLRMSCIYGPRQFGTEDQGWVAHFLIRALAGEPITIYGDGRQVRDVLHVHDAVAAYRALLRDIDAVSGQAFNLGGGPSNAVSLRMVLDEIERLEGRRVAVDHADWRQGDQLWFVADTARLSAAVGWRQTIGWKAGVAALRDWLTGTDIAAKPRRRAAVAGRRTA